MGSGERFGRVKQFVRRASARVVKTFKRPQVTALIFGFAMGLATNKLLHATQTGDITEATAGLIGAALGAILAVAAAAIVAGWDRDAERRAIEAFLVRCSDEVLISANHLAGVLAGAANDAMQLPQPSFSKVADSWKVGQSLAALLQEQLSSFLRRVGRVEDKLILLHLSQISAFHDLEDLAADTEWITTCLGVEAIPLKSRVLDATEQAQLFRGRWMRASMHLARG